jgi:hypothetical protein
MVKKPLFPQWLVALLLLGLCAPGIAGEVLRFQVYLDDKPIGEHSFRISESGETRRISSSASFDVDFLFVNAYRYRHSSSEVFRDGCLQEIRATTDDNGKRYRVQGSALGEGFRVEHQDGVEQADGCLMTFAYWDRDFLRQKRLLNAQTGGIEGVTVRQKGRDDVAFGSRKVSATRYALRTDKLTIDLWYNDALGWVGLSSDTGKGRRLIYRRM